VLADFVPPIAQLVEHARAAVARFVLDVDPSTFTIRPSDPSTYTIPFTSTFRGFKLAGAVLTLAQDDQRKPCAIVLPSGAWSGALTHAGHLAPRWGPQTLPARALLSAQHGQEFSCISQRRSRWGACNFSGCGCLSERARRECVAAPLYAASAVSAG
jgi:hypothetical protein